MAIGLRYCPRIHPKDEGKSFKTYNNDSKE
jgi:hypothetical protein